MNQLKRIFSTRLVTDGIPFVVAALMFLIPVMGWGGPVRSKVSVTPTSAVSENNFLSNCDVKANDLAQWIVSCDYGITSFVPSENNVVDHARGTFVVNWIRKDGIGRIAKDEKGNLPAERLWHESGVSTLVPRGRGRVVAALRPAVDSFGNSAFTTTSITIDLILSQPEQVTLPKYSKVEANNIGLASREIELVINWPDRETWNRDIEVITKPVPEVLQHAMQLISTANPDRLIDAKKLLERLLIKEPRAAQAYVELARIAMKTNWGTEGFRQADALLSSALQVESGHINALILRGYVYTHQGRMAEAERVFQSVNKVDLKNLWLWANWGQLHAKRGKTQEAIAMYQKAIEQPPTGDTYDLARIDAYEHLFPMLLVRKDFDEMERLHEQRIQENEVNNCFGAEYALFKLRLRGDYLSAISIAEKSSRLGCKCCDQVLGLGSYTAWALSNGSDRHELLNRARVHLPPGARVLYELSESEHTLIAVTKLLAIGEHIDQIDNQRMTAFAYAIDNRSYEAVSRLLRLGAKPTAAVGAQGIPAALIPVLSNDYEGIRVLKRLGIDYSKISYQGLSALDLAKRMGDSKIIDALKVPGPKV